MSQIHETLSREEKIVAGSDRSFGIVMAVAFGVLATISWWRAGSWWIWLGALSAAFLLCAMLRPAMMHPLNILWLKFGLLLHQIVNPIIMGAMFYGAVWPTGIIMRALGKDLLRLKRRPDVDSYWIARQPPGPPPQSMKDQ